MFTLNDLCTYQVRFENHMHDGDVLANGLEMTARRFMINRFRFDWDSNPNYVTVYNHLLANCEIVTCDITGLLRVQDVDINAGY